MNNLKVILLAVLWFLLGWAVAANVYHWPYSCSFLACLLRAM